MKINIDIEGKKFMQAQQGTIAKIRIKGGDEILGVVQVCETRAGVEFPTFSIKATSHVMPIVFMIEDDPVVRFEVSDVALQEYISVPHRRALAAFYGDVCRHKGWEIDDSCTLNVIHWLEKNGLTTVSQEHAQQMIGIIEQVRRHFYAYVELMALTDEEILNPVKVH